MRGGRRQGQGRGAIKGTAGHRCASAVLNRDTEQVSCTGYVFF